MDDVGGTVTPALVAGLEEASVAARDLLEGADRVILTTHVQPDGDGIGAEVALAQWLRSRGKRVTILNPHPTARAFRFLEPDPPIVPFEPDVAAALFETADLLVVLDISVPDRLGPLEPLVRTHDPPILIIDHHAGRSAIEGLDVRDVHAAATGEIVYRLLKAWHAEFTPEIATALYAAIAYDTGGFRYSNTRETTHRLAAELFALGADVVAVHHHLFESRSLATVRLLGRVLSSFELSGGGRLAWVAIPQAMMKEVGAEVDDVEGIVEMLRAVEGVLVAILFKELGERATKISFRSSGATDVNAFARRFGGGGHRNAAGAYVREPMAEVMARVLAAAHREFDAAPAD